MRAFIVALVLAMPLALVACQPDTPTEEVEDVQEEIVDDGAPAGDSADVVGDGEVIDDAGEPEGGVGADGTAGAGEAAANVFGNADTDHNGDLNAAEFAAAWPDADMAGYDGDGNGMVSQAEFDAYVAAHPE